MMPIHFPFSRTIRNYFEDKAFRRSLIGWCFSENRIVSLLALSRSGEWRDFYLPVSVKNKTVLDVGANQGDSAKFFIDNGASKVIAIECCDKAFQYLAANAKLHPQIVPIHKRFDLSDLDREFDFLKVDIEGYEYVLLDRLLSTPAVLEVHGLPLIERFRNAGYKIKYPSESCQLGYSCLCYAYWNPMQNFEDKKEMKV
jgi:hypothetical protein